ncbi:hypothetical protein [Absidia glauca]|uniref:Uncharacterized protein n=1 Tax=Absidia glauca TaxID=4829 RepID=A0A163J048_ABSGL|nr:hypothetical protein [Absidia glauca]
MLSTSDQQVTQSEPVNELEEEDIDICLQPDPLKLLNLLAYLLEAGEKTKEKKLIDINTDNINSIITSSEATLAAVMNAKSAEMLLNYDKLDQKEDLLFLRLCLSHIITTVPSTLSQRTKNLIGSDEYNDLKLRAQRLFELYHQPLAPTLINRLDSVVNAYTMDGLVAARIALCNMKNELLFSDPYGDALIALDCMESVVILIETWNVHVKSLEADYYVRFLLLFDYVFRGTNIKMTRSDSGDDSGDDIGDTASTATKNVRAHNEKLFAKTTKRSVCDGKIDGIIAYKDLELSLCEFKPLSVSLLPLLEQHVKNIMTSSCIFRNLESLRTDPQHHHHHNYGLDFNGNVGTMFILCSIDGVMVATEVAELIIPYDPYDLVVMKNTIALLFDLKTHMKKLAQTFRPLQEKSKRQR